MTTRPMPTPDALALLNSITKCDCPPIGQCRHDLRYHDARALLIDDDAELESDIPDLIRMLITRLSDDRHIFSTLLLDFSLCPMHRIDYAACFDDDDDECAMIRTYFPDHDT